MRSPMTLSITTRGIGINLCSLYADVSSLLCSTDDDEEKVELPNIYAIYRALLGLVESRFLNIDRPFSQRTYDYSPILRNYYNIMNIPIIFKRYLEAINVVPYKNIIYYPAMSEDIIIEGKFIPRPENIILSNLRQTVQALKGSDVHDDDTALQHRKNFYKNNPIPGAIWDTNYKLINADEIINPDYDLHNDVYDDMHTLLSLSMKLSKYSKYINKDCANRNKTGNIFSSFICSEMGELRVPDRKAGQKLYDYYWNCRPIGDIDTFYSRFILRKEDIVKEGALFLHGEYPNNERFAKPICEPRAEHVNSYFYRGFSHQSSYLSYHSDIVARSLQNA